MARIPTTFDVFNAIAEPKRRQLLTYLSSGEKNVSEMVVELGWVQPMVSKHLSVLRQVGLVRVRREGRQQVYAMDADKLKPVHEWTRTFERFWSSHLDQIKMLAESRHRESVLQKYKKRSQKE